MKLEVGMYVRTDNGIIGKIYEKIGDMFTYKDSNRDYITYDLLHSEITKASYNIIDLIEVGDIIVDDTNRKLEVLLIDNELMVRNAGLIYDNNYYLPIKSIAIKSVITHEQMEQMAYKVEE